MSRIEQGTHAWHEMRRKHLGASDAAVVLGISPFKTRLQLWKEKRGLWTQEETPAMKRGKVLEDEALNKISDYLDMILIPDVKISSKVPYIMASLDGIDIERKFAVEIKCPGKKNLEEYREKGIPGYYYAQLQVQMFVYDLSFMHVCFYSPDDIFDGKLLQKIERDEVYIEYYLKEAEKFWHLVEGNIEPELENSDIVQRNDEEYKELACEYAVTKKRLDRLEEELSEIKEKLILLCENKSSTGFGVRCRKYEAKGSIEYKNIPQLKEIDLEKYRKPKSIRWTISLEK